jgi:hypothetical protein
MKDNLLYANGVAWTLFLIIAGTLLLMLPEYFANDSDASTLPELVPPSLFQSVALSLTEGGANPHGKPPKRKCRRARPDCQISPSGVLTFGYKKLFLINCIRDFPRSPYDKNIHDQFSYPQDLRFQ